MNSRGIAQAEDAVVRHARAIDGVTAVTSDIQLTQP